MNRNLFELSETGSTKDAFHNVQICIDGILCRTASVATKRKFALSFLQLVSKMHGTDIASLRKRDWNQSLLQLCDELLGRDSGAKGNSLTSSTPKRKRGEESVSDSGRSFCTDDTFLQCALLCLLLLLHGSFSRYLYKRNFLTAPGFCLLDDLNLTTTLV